MNQSKNNFLNVIPTGILLFAFIIFSQSFCSVAAAPQIVGMSIAPHNNQYYIWYDDGNMSMSSTPDDTRGSLYGYSLPSGKSPNSIVSIGIDADGRVYTWYNDGSVSEGTIFELHAHEMPYRFSLPWGKSVNNIVGMGISNNNHVYTWYEDGTMSIGEPHDLDIYDASYTYSLPQRKSASNLVGVNISHNNDYVYAWYRGDKSTFFDYNDKTTSDDYYVHNKRFDASENLQFKVNHVRSINSTVSDFAPSFYKNNLMFSTFRRGNGNNSGNSSQVYISKRSDTKLYRPQLLRKGYRAAMSNESAPSFTEDGGQVAYVRNKNFDNGTLPHMGNNAKMDIYLADAVSQNDWQNKKGFPYNNRKYSNGYPHLSSNGDVLYFASNMLGGYGGYDIYECEKIGNSWSKPINLGPGVNTEGDEISPFLAENTLYFASDGHDGYGNFDIFKSLYGNRGWNQAVNMGEDINSFYDDYDFIYKPYEKIAYFTSNRAGGLGDDDIYQATAELEYTAPPKKQQVIQVPSLPNPQFPTSRPSSVVSTPDRMIVIVRDEKTKQPLENARIEATCDRKIYITDAGGLAVLEQFDRDCNIRISKSGYGTSIHRFPTAKHIKVELVPNTPTIVYQPTTVSPPERTVLVVRDKQNKAPLAGVQIDMSTCNGGIYTTDANGLVVLERFDGNCVMRIRKNGYESNLHSFPTMAQLGVELKRLGEGHTSVILELEPDPVYSNPITTTTIYTDNDLLRRRSNNSRPARLVTNRNYSNTREIYEVQIGAYRTPHPELEQNFEHLGKVYFYMKNDVMIYKVGSFTNYNDAEYARIFLSNNGHPDAFIDKVAGSVPAAYRSSSPTNFTSSPANSMVYKIQLGVFRNPGNATFNSGLAYFGDIQQTIGADGLTVFSLGDFYSMSEATKAQENAMNLGVNKAFIVKYRDGVKVGR